jgi:hypothetical protein
MAYERTIWKNREVERPRTFTMQDNEDGTVTLVPTEGQIIEPGTPIIAAIMNNIEDGIEEAHNSIGNINDPTLPAELKGKALTEQTKYVLANAGKVKSVNSKTGEVQLTGDDIPIANGVQSSISTNISDLYNSRIRKSGDTLTGILNLQANTSWINATLINGWTGTIKYRKDACGVVHVTGNCSHNTPAGAVFQLPVGYRPQYDVMETAFTLISEYILCTAELYPTGDLYIGRGQPHKTIYFNFSFIAT